MKIIYDHGGKRDKKIAKRIDALYNDILSLKSVRKHVDLWELSREKKEVRVKLKMKYREMSKLEILYWTKPLPEKVSFITKIKRIYNTIKNFLCNE